MRTRVFQSALASVDDLYCAAGDQTNTTNGFSPDFQVCLPYQGLFVWHVGRDDVVGDVNQVLFVSGGEAYRVSQPGKGGYGELIVTPALSLLSDLAATSEERLWSHPLFVRRSQRANVRLQKQRARFLHLTANGHHDPLAIEEALTNLLRSAFEKNAANRPPEAATRRLIQRTEVFLDGHSSRPLRLVDVAAAVGASPAYLTDIFRRVEGVPLHRYLVQLRLANALRELPQTNDLTALALALGFSSHSHFTFAFRQAFHCTPSAFRELTRHGRDERRARAKRHG